MNNKNLLLLYVLSLALVLLIFSIYLPWWSIRTSNDANVVLGGSASIDFKVWQTVSVDLRLNRTRSVEIGISDLASSPEDVRGLGDVLNVTSTLAVIGLALTAILWVLTIFSVIKRSLVPRRVFNLLVIVVGILLLVGPIYMFAMFYPFVPKLQKFSSFNFPETWVQIHPRDVTFFWGAIKIPGNIGFPSYLVGKNFWIWGAGAGWFACFASGLILFCVAILSWQMIPRKVF